VKSAGEKSLKSKASHRWADVVAVTTPPCRSRPGSCRSGRPLRGWLHARRPLRPLGALADDGIGAALRAMHADVAHRWTLKELASISCMSRSAFAASFKRQVGLAPLEYLILIDWRMSLARDALRRNTRSISELASATGYQSESAFSTGFRRVVGSSPHQFRDSARTALDSRPNQESIFDSVAI
jgi:AraC-like DNA-binding protein